MTLDGFWIDETEISIAQYTQCVDARECTATVYTSDSTYKGDGYPVVGVSWNDADAYCRWVEGQLPTEAQWEYAARGPDANTYPWGEEEPTCKLAQYCDCGGWTVPTGSRPEGASWVGVLDMAGNVWEWVNDWYDSNYHATSLAENPTGPESGENRVLRGGGWNYSPFLMRGAYRLIVHPEFGLKSVGLRCVLPGR